jgi:hypothetical protein
MPVWGCGCVDELVSGVVELTETEIKMTKLTDFVRFWMDFCTPFGRNERSRWGL